MNKNLIALAILSALVGCDNNNDKETTTPTTPTEISGDITVIDDGSGQLSGQVQLSNDVTVVASDQQEDYGSFSINESGSWEFIAEPETPGLYELISGETVSEEVTVMGSDGTSHVITVTLQGVDDAPQIGQGSGVDTLTIDSTTSEPVSGTLTINDPDLNQSAFIAQTDTAGMHGMFSILETGVWTYTLKDPTPVTSLPTASIMSESETQLSDTFKVMSVDGTEKDVVIYINDATPPLSACTGTKNLPIISATDDGTSQEANPPSNTIDLDPDTRWSSEYTDTGKLLTFDLGELAKVKQLELLWHKAGERTTYYNIETSVDNENWSVVLLDGESSIITDGSYEAVDLIESEARYVRLTGLGNSSSGWVSLSEAKVLGCMRGDVDDGGGDNGGGDNGGGDNGTPNATFSGDDSVTITNDTTSDIEGTIYINDEDDGEDIIVEQNDTSTAYGTFSINEDGEWTYSLDDSNADVAELADENDSLTDTITITSADGSTSSISITITGLADSGGGDNGGGDNGGGDIGGGFSPEEGGSYADGYTNAVPTITCTKTVKSLSELEDAAEELVAGDTLCLANGTYKGDLELRVEGAGTAEKPITVAAETSGEAIVSEGEIYARLGGSHIVLQGFVFRDGTSGSSIIKFEKETECHYCRVTELSIIDMDGGDYGSSKWIEFYGQYNRVDHSWFSGKESRGALLVLPRWISEDDFDEATFPADYAQIDYNYFGDRPPAFGKAYAGSSDNEYEGIRLGLSTTHSADANSVVENNYFERIQGEAEVISNKSSNNIIRNNTVRDSNGSIVNRHGHAATITNNLVIGDDNPFSGGIRVSDRDHVVTNNYIEGARYLSSNWNGGIVLTTGDGAGPTDNGYQNVDNILVANNTIVDSVNSFNVYGGKNDEKPSDVYFVNNIIADAIGAVIKNADEMPENSTYAGNYVYGLVLSDDDEDATVPGMVMVDAVLEADGKGIYRPSDNSPTLVADSNVDLGDFNLPTTDMDGQTRSDTTTSGADEVLTSSVTMGLLSAADVGPKNYRPMPGKIYVQKVAIANHDFDTGNLDGWTNVGGEIATDPEDVFSRGASLMLDDNSDSVSQIVTVTPNTNYTLSAFMKGKAQLSVDVNGSVYKAERSSDEYGFESVSFNSGDQTSVTIKAAVDDLVVNTAPIVNPKFDNGDDDWESFEGTGIGQVQESSNSSDSTDGSIKFVWKEDDFGNPYQPYIAQTVDVEANTDYTFSMYQLLKNDTDSTIRFGVFIEDTDTLITDATILTDKVSVYSDLEAAGADKGDDSFLQDTLTINTGSNTTLTIFAQLQTASGDEIRVDEFKLSYEGAPENGTEAYFDSIRLVSHPLSEAESEKAEND